MELRALICGVAHNEMGAARRSPKPDEWDLENLLVPSEGRKEDYLAVLRAARLVAAAVEVTARMAARRAVWLGATYAEVGAAEGISRQAARQRHARESARRPIRFVGGPRDGKQSVAIGSEREIRHGEWAGPWEEDEGRHNDEFPQVTAVYRAKYGSPDVFEFHHYEKSEDGTVIAEWDRRPRVHELARYWFTESAIVLAEARALDSAVRTPSSRVNFTILEPLREALRARLGGRLSSALLPSALPESDEPSSTYYDERGDDGPMWDR